MMKASRGIALCVALLAVGACSSRRPLLAAEGDPEITGIRLGIAGRYKVGYWTPVEVALKGGQESLQGKLEVTVPDGDGVPTQIDSPPNRPIALAAGKQTSATLFAKIGQMMPNVRVRLLVDGKPRATRDFDASTTNLPDALASERPMLVTVGRPLAITTPSDDDHALSPVYATIDDPSQFPTRWYGYDGVNAVILCTSDPAKFRSLSADSSRIAALREWVKLGGKLVLCVGSAADEVLAPGAPLAGFLPGKFTGTVPLRRTNAWEAFVETPERLDVRSMTDVTGQPRLDVPRLENVLGRIEAYEGSRPEDLPLVVRSAFGLGVVVFVAADLDRPPFTKWAAREQMLDKLLAREPRKPQSADAAGSSNAAATYGYVDLAGQLRSALEQFEGVKLVPFSLVAALIVLYILAIGPLDYFLLKRGIKRMEFTRVTFPAIVLAFSGMSYLLAYWLKGDQLRVNQVDVVDYDASSRLVRGTSWSNVFSPRVDAYNLSYAPQLPDKGELTDRQVLTAWTGLPGAGFGGMGSPSGAAALFTGSYRFTPSLDAVEGMPIAVWSTKGVTGRWHGTAASPVVAELTARGDNLLAGTLQSRLDVPLTDCVLIYDRWAYPIGKLEPRSRLTVEKQLDSQTVETYFKQASLYDNRATLSTYDASGRQTEKIVEAMLFYNYLGGEAYTNLSNEFHQFIDGSNLLNAGRAVLFGRGPLGGGKLIRDGKPLANDADRRWTFYRFVFAVEPRSEK
jgi:hypothetical protein